MSAARRNGLASALLALAACAALAARPCAGADLQRFLGKRVSSLTFRGDAAVDEAALAALTALRPGDLVSPDAVRTTLRNLFATSQFSDLWVEAVPEGDGVALTLAFYGAPRVHSVAFLSSDVPDRGRLKDAIGFGAGDFWSPRLGEAAAKSLGRLLKERGFFEAEVRVESGPGPGETTVDVRVVVVPGPRARAGPPRFTGPLEPLPKTALAALVKPAAGEAYRESLAKESAAELLEAYRAAGYARAEVRFEESLYDRAGRLASPRYAVYVGPRVVLRVEGATESDVKKHAASPWARGEPPDEEASRRLAEALKRGYQESGFAKAEVDVDFPTTRDELVVAYRVAKGSRYAVSRVDFRGNRRLPDDALRAVVTTRARGVFSSGRLVDADLAADRAALAELYRSKGYRDAKVLPVEVEDGVAPFTLDVVFRVEEGAPTFVAERKIEGLTALPAEEAEGGLAVHAGSPFDAAAIDADVSLLRSRLGDRGYVDARVEARVEPAAAFEAGPERDGEAAERVDVTYAVFEGAKVAFGETVIRGNRTTRLGVVQRELAHAEGEPFSLQKLVETQQALARLGIFSRVDLSSFPTDPETGRRSVLVSLAEAKPWNVLYGIGAEFESRRTPQFSPRLSLGVSHDNLFGRAIVAGVEGRYSRGDTRLLLTLKERSLFDTGVPLSVTAFRAKELRESFDVDRRGAFLETEKRFSATFKGAFRYQYEIVDPKEKVPGTLERQNQRNFISSVGPSVTLDTRDDPIDPKRGAFLATDVKLAFPFGAADAEFFKVFGQLSLYRRLGRGVLAGSVRVGGIEPFGPNVERGLPNLSIPIPERFFAGGRATHRAFDFDELGIVGQTILLDDQGVRTFIGGDGLALANLEYRLPLVGDVGASFFLDAGNVWSEPRKLRFADVRLGVGVGLNYKTPVGPIRVEYGLKLDKKPGESVGAFHFSIGYPF